MQSPLQNWHNSISIALTIRNKADEEDPDNYHWLFWIVAGDTVNGTCAHANNQSGSFHFEKKKWSAGTSMSLTALIKVGSLGTHTVESVVAILEQIPMASPAGTEDEHVKFSCRIWLREAIRVLNQQGIIACNDVNALQAECEKHADTNKENIELGRGKPIFVISHVSK